MALHRIKLNAELEPIALLTTATREFNRSSMHGIRLELIRAQAEAIGLPLEIVWIESGGDNQSYETAMRRTLQKFQTRGVSRVAFGDIHLEDVRTYREKNLARIGMQALFPLWGSDPSTLIRDWLRQGFHAVVSCVDTRSLPASYSGRELDEAFLRELPESCDPCGENGEFHTFAWSGPVFSDPIPWIKGESVLRDNRFQYCDLLPSQADKMDTHRSPTKV